MLPRSYLFVPGDRDDMLARAGTRGADAVIVDLEDAVAPDSKADARTNASRWIAAQTGDGPEIWVRINPGPAGLSDLAAVLRRPLRGLMLPKVNDGVTVQLIAEALEPFEEADGLESGSIELLPIVETPLALLNVFAIASAPRVRQLMLGSIDLGAALGVSPDSDAWPTLQLQLVVASAAAGIEPPLGPVNPDFDDLEKLEAETRRLYEMGYRSRPAIHPRQVEVFNDALAPTAAEVAWAVHVLEEYDQALAAGQGTFKDDRGNMVDEAVVKAARRILE
ncbi:MAG: CoA ester lyase [Acidimicrobiia bacterium]|nr:CoA ester lyase [Acidimicrobiia bacterium]